MYRVGVYETSRLYYAITVLMTGLIQMISSKVYWLVRVLLLRLGPGHRASLSNREVAQALALHESTVSRAVSGKFFECKWGVFPLKSMFIRRTAATTSAAGDLDEILHKLQTLIASEPPGAAYSDHHLASLLSAEGIRIARRTVAKYRLMLGLPTASERNAERQSPPRGP